MEPTAFDYSFGLDTVVFSLYIAEEDVHRLKQRIRGKEGVQSSYIETSRHYRGLYVTMRGRYLIVLCSAATFMQGHNAWGLPLERIPEFIETLADVLGFDVKNANLQRFDPCLDLRTDYPSSSYMKVIADHHHYTLTHFPKSGGLSLGNGRRRYTFYAKDLLIRSMRKQRSRNRNMEMVLRNEKAKRALQDLGNPSYLRIDLTQMRGALYQMSKFTGVRLTLQDLHDPGVYEAVLRKFQMDMEHATYRGVVADDLTGLTVSGKEDRDKLATRLLIASQPLEYMLLLNRSRAAKVMSKKTRQEMRRELDSIKNEMSVDATHPATEMAAKVGEAIIHAIHSLEVMPSWYSRTRYVIPEESEDGSSEYEEGDEEYANVA